ncbi:MAG: hypothetical protein ACXWLR_00425 [Myxococcales bacterium]
MTSADRAIRALHLAAVAALGLVVTPLLHAEEHRREAREDEAEVAAAVEAWAARSGDPLDALAFALAHAHQAPRPRESTNPHGHSHGPAGSGPHGWGTLAHLCLALHAAPQLPELATLAGDHAAPAPIRAQLRGTLRYLVPEWSQGPPAGC